MGVARDGSHKPDYAPGLELHAKYTFFAEGVRGHLTKMLKLQFALDADCEPQVYGLGVKELGEIDTQKHEQGRVIQTQGWPMDENANRSEERSVGQEGDRKWSSRVSTDHIKKKT